MAPILKKRRDQLSDLEPIDHDGNMDAIEQSFATIEQALASIGSGGSGGKTFHVDVRDFSSIDPTGVSDSTTGLTSAISQARTANKPLVMIGGTFLVSTLQVPSNTVIAGTPGLTKIKSNGADAPILASASYYAASGSAIAGRTVLRDLAIIGTNDPSKTNQHGVLLRDYYSTLDRLEVLDTGGSAIRLVHLNDAGSAAAVPLNENTIIGLRARNIRGVNPVYLGDALNPALVNGVLRDAVVYGYRATTTAGYTLLFCGNAAGWSFEGLHLYVSGAGAVIPATAIDLRRPGSAALSDIFVEHWSASAINLVGLTGGTTLDNLRIACDNAAAAGSAVYCDAEVGAAPVYQINGLALTRATGSTSAYGITAAAGTTVNLSVPPTLSGAQAGTLLRYHPVGTGVVQLPNATGDWTAVNSRTSVTSAQREFNILAEGAVRDRNVDSLAAIQAAVTKAQAVGGKVIIPPGDFMTSSAVLVTNHNVQIEGSGQGSVLFNGDTDGPIFLIGNQSGQLTGISVRHLQFMGRPGVTGVAGQCAILARNIGKCRFDNLQTAGWLQKLYDGIIFDLVTQSYYEWLQIGDTLHDGITFKGHCLDMYMSNCRCDSTGNDGIVIDGCEGGYFTNVACWGNGNHAWEFLHNASQDNYNYFFANCIGDTSGQSNWLISNLGSAYFTQCWFSAQPNTTTNPAAVGLRMIGGKIKHCFFTAGGALANNGHGVELAPASGGAPAGSPTVVQFQGFEFGSDRAAGIGNGKGGTGGFGLRVGTGCTKITVMGGACLGNIGGTVSNAASASELTILNLRGYN